MLPLYRIRKNILSIYTLIFLIFIVPRLIHLGWDIANFDSSYWYPRMDRFTSAMLKGEYQYSYQKYHPGVTMLWTSGSSKYAFEKVFEAVFDFNPRRIPHQFPRMHFVTKLPLVLMISALAVWNFHILKKLINKKFALIFTIVLSLEPFFLGVSRFLHLSALTAMLMFSSFLTLVYYYKKNKKRNIKLFILSAALMGLGTLTKIDAVIALPVNALMVLFYEFKQKDKFYGLKDIVIKGLFYLGIVIFVFYIFFPSMWVAPWWTINKIISEGIKDTAFNSSGAETFLDFKAAFYPETILYRSLPTTFFALLAGFFLFKSKKFKKGQQAIFAWVIFYFIFNIVILTIPDKIKDRYLINLYPPIALIASITIFYLIERKDKLIKWGTITILSFMYLFMIYEYHPVYSFYYSELIGGPEGIHKLGLPIKNRGEFYARAALFINEYDDNAVVRNVILSHREQIRTFSPFFIGETFSTPGVMKDDYEADYILTRPDFEHLIPQDMCKLIKGFGPRGPFRYETIRVYECDGITNQYKDFNN